MGMVTDFFAAPRSRAHAVLNGDTSGLPALELSCVDPVKLASLERILGRTLRKGGRAGATEMLSQKDAGQWVLLVPASLVELLACAGDVALEVGTEWAATRELQADGWTEPDAREAVAALCQLASQAKSAHSDVLLRMAVPWERRYVARRVG
jgi:hypothetical protein